MRSLRTAALAGIAALAVAGTALAAANDTHILKVAMPDGSVARIAYRGDVPPQVAVAPARVITPIAWFDASDAAPFATFDRIMAEMDRQTATMMQQVAAMQAGPTMGESGPSFEVLQSMPAGMVHYSMVSTSGGSGTCSRSMQVTSMGAGEKPKVVSSSSGDCGPSATVPAAAGASRPTPALTIVDLKQPAHKPPTTKTTT